MPSLSAIASFNAACRSLTASASVLDRAAADHLGQDPELVTWATAEHAQRLARQVEALAAEVRAFGGIR
jgi:hypothetical protein